MGSTPKHPGYVKMKDTPWITQGREIADIGGKGVLDNYGKVNVFDEATQASLNARNNDIYNRAFGDMERAYTDTMNKYNAANYNQFGTLNATSPAYRTDEYQRQFQRQLDDLAYNKAINYENLINNELQRRYNTLDMFGNMYNYGRIPYDLDLKNWNTENTNRDIGYMNAMQSANNSFGNWLLGTVGTAVGTGLNSFTGSFGKGLGNMLTGQVGGGNI